MLQILYKNMTSKAKALRPHDRGDESRPSQVVLTPEVKASEGPRQAKSPKPQLREIVGKGIRHPRTSIHLVGHVPPNTVRGPGAMILNIL